MQVQLGPAQNGARPGGSDLLFGKHFQGSGAARAATAPVEAGPALTARQGRSVLPCQPEAANQGPRHGAGIGACSGRVLVAAASGTSGSGTRLCLKKSRHPELEGPSRLEFQGLVWMFDTDRLGTLRPDLRLVGRVVERPSCRTNGPFLKSLLLMRIT